MNTTLSIHIEHDHLIAAVEPLNEKFQLISRRGLNRFPFYFLIDEVNNKLDYSFVYAEDYKKGKNDVIGDFLTKILEPSLNYKWYNYEIELINLLLLILDDVKEAYNHIIRSLDATTTLGNSAIPVFLSFSDNVPAKSKFILRDFIAKQNFEIIKDNISLPQLLVNYFIEEHGDESEQKIAVIESLGDNMNMSIVSIYNSYDRERTHFKQFIDFGIDPRIQVISQKIVEDLNRQEGLLKDSDEKKLEYKRQIPKAQALIMQIESSGKPYLKVETNFAIDETKLLSTNLEVAEIDRLTSFHVRQISRFFSDNFLLENGMKVEEISHILLLGNTLCNEIIKKEFSRFGFEKLHYYTSENINLALRQAVNFERPKKNITATKSINSQTTDNKEQKDFVEVPYLTLANLKPGQNVKITAFDPTPGKGESLKILEFIKELEFKVISSTRTLLSGDNCKSLIPVWAPGMQIDFQVERMGKKLGQYKTRQVVKIELK